MLAGPSACAKLSGIREAIKQAHSAKATPLRNFFQKKELLFFSIAAASVSRRS